MGPQTRKWSSRCRFSYLSLAIFSESSSPRHDKLTRCCRAFTLALGRFSCPLTYCRSVRAALRGVAGSRGAAFNHYSARPSHGIYSMTVTFYLEFQSHGPIFMTRHMQTNQGQKSVGLKERNETMQTHRRTDRQTDGRTALHTLFTMRAVKYLVLTIMSITSR